jgi:hypothetical protein
MGESPVFCSNASVQRSDVWPVLAFLQSLSASDDLRRGFRLLTPINTTVARFNRRSDAELALAVDAGFACGIYTVY